MQSVSKAYKEQMQKGIRNPSYVLVEYDVFNLEAEENAALADNGHTVFSSLDIKGRSESKPSYASFEPNRWKLDGSLLLLPTSSSSYQNTGYVSSAVSGSDGGFEVNPTITVTFSTPKTFYGFTMVFDEAAGEYPSEIAINGNRYFPTDVRFAAQEEIIEASSVTITFVNTGKPYRRARLTQLMFGQIMKFDSANLIQVSFSSKIDLLSTKLSQKSFTFVLDNSNQAYNPLNPSNLLQFAEERQPIKFQFGYELDDGTVEWVAPESLTLKGSPATKQMQASFTAQDKLNLLTGMYYKGLYRPAGISLYDLAVDVLDDAGVTDYLIDERLQSITTKGALPATTHGECLQIIANAAQCVLYTDRDGKIRIVNAIDPMITPYDNGHAYYSSPDGAFNDLEPPARKYIDFFPDSWEIGNGQLALLPEKGGKYYRVGFVSESICDASGNFSSPPVYGLKFSFAYPSYAIPITFDAIGGEYAASFTVTYFRRGQQVDSVTVNNNTSVTYTVEKSVPKADDIQIKIMKWSHGTRRAIITRIGGGRINDFLIGLGDSLQEPEIAKQALCKSVTVNCYNYTPEAEAKELYKETVGVAGQQTDLQINHQAATELSAVMAGGTVISQTHYTYQSIVTVSGEGELTISGKALTATTTGVVQKVNPKGEDKPALQNPLITDTARAAEVAEWVADYFAKRNHITVQYRGSPELDANDLVYLASRFDPYFPIRLTELSLTYNGGLGGKVKAVMI